MSTIEVDYVELSLSMRDVIPLIQFIEDLKLNLPLEKNTPKLHYTVFEDNQGFVNIVECPKMRPRTKHIAIKYHYFLGHVGKTTYEISKKES